MGEDSQYTLWVKPAMADGNLQAAIDKLQEVEGVTGANAEPLSGTGAISRDAVIAITLSVAANFATDGLKAVFELLTEDEAAEIIMCRKPDGSEEDLEAIKVLVRQ